MKTRVQILMLLATLAVPVASNGAVIVTEGKAESLLTLAAREVRRYVYLRTGELPPIDVFGKDSRDG